MRSLRWLKDVDWPLFTAILLLFGFGIVALWGLTYTGAVSKEIFVKQVTWGVLAVFISLGFSLFDYRLLRDRTFLVVALYVLGLIFLGALFFFGTSVRGAVSWFKFFSFTVEPIEFIKIIMLVFLAKYFSARHIELYGLRHIVVSGCYVVVPALLALLQPDLGSAMVLGGVWLGIILFSGIRMRHFLLLCLLSFVISAALWVFTLSGYQKDRVLSFIQPQADPLGISYNVRQSMIAVGSGRFLGKGLGYGTQSHLQFLPEAETDFIFSAISEEWGFMGSSILLFIFAFVFWRILSIGFKADNNFARFFSLGFSILICLQFTIHVGMNMGLLPVTGLTLPFVSYGGSSLVSLAVGIGVIQSIAVRNRLSEKVSVAQESAYFIAY